MYPRTMFTIGEVKSSFCYCTWGGAYEYLVSSTNH